MNVLNGIFENSLKQNLTYLLAIGGGIYIFKSTYEMISGFLKNRNQNKEIKILIQNEKAKIKQELLNNSKFEVCFYLYYKILHTIFKKDIIIFTQTRRNIFNQDDIERYITYVEDYLKILKFIEQHILQIIYEELEIDSTVSDNFKNDKFDIK